MLPTSTPSTSIDPRVTSTSLNNDAFVKFPALVAELYSHYFSTQNNGTVRMRDVHGSMQTHRKRVSSRVLFPHPVRPQIPTLSPGATLNDTRLSTSGRSSRYRTSTSVTLRRPLCGQSWSTACLHVG